MHAYTTHPSAKPPSSSSTASAPAPSGTHPTASTSPNSSSPATNHIEIHVYNTALNAWSALPPHDYKPLIEKYGDRFQMQDLDKVQPIPSGILGKIHLVTEAP